MKIKDTLLALVVITIWGVNFSIIKIGLEELPPILFSALRFAIVAIPAVIYVPFPETSAWNVIGVGVFLGVIKFSLLFVAMKADASAGLASLILQAQVIFTIVLSVVILKEQIKKTQIIGIIISIAGFSLFFFNTEGNITYLGLSLILLAAFSWGISNLIMKRIKDVNLIHFMVWVSLIPPLPLLILSLLIEETTTPATLILSLSPQAWLSLAYVGYISTLVAFAIWGWLLKKHPAATIIPFALLIPVTGIISSSFILDERLTESDVAGTLLIMISLIMCVLGDRVVNFWSHRTMLKKSAERPKTLFE